MNYLPGGHEIHVGEEMIMNDLGLKEHSKTYLHQTFSAIRVVPFIYELIDLIKVNAPDAWLLNATPGLGITSESVLRYIDFEKYIGVSGIQHKMAQMTSDLLHIDQKQLTLNFVGPSELSFLTALVHKKKNILPKLIENYTLTYDDWSKGLLSTLSVLPQQNHHKYYSQDQENLDFILSSIDFAKSSVSMMRSMIEDIRDYQVVTTLNDGHVLDLYHGCAIEITSRMTKDGPVPIFIGRLPVQIRGFIQYVKSTEEHISDAIYAKSLYPIKQILKLHLCSQHIEHLDEVFDQFVLLEKQYLKFYEEIKS
jgi:6-phospho-beta-glucosidase